MKDESPDGSPMINTDAEIAAALRISRMALSKARHRGLTAQTIPEAIEQWPEVTQRLRSDGPVQLASREAKDHWQAELIKQRVMERKGLLVPKAEAVRATTEAVSILRSAVVSFPDEYGEAMASEIGVDPALLRQVVKRFLYKHMENAGILLKRDSSPPQIDHQSSAEASA